MFLGMVNQLVEICFHVISPLAPIFTKESWGFGGVIIQDCESLRMETILCAGWPPYIVLPNKNVMNKLQASGLWLLTW